MCVVCKYDDVSKSLSLPSSGLDGGGICNISFESLKLLSLSDQSSPASDNVPRVPWKLADLKTELSRQSFVVSSIFFFCYILGFFFSLRCC